MEGGARWSAGLGRRICHGGSADPSQHLAEEGEFSSSKRADLTKTLNSRADVAELAFHVRRARKSPF